MTLLLTEEEVRDLLHQTGALRRGHFILPNGMHTETYLETAQALRYYHNARILSVGLSRLLRRVPAVRPHLPKVAVVTSSSSGIPVAFGVREALDADEIFWAEYAGDELRFREFIAIRPGDKFILVNDGLLDGGPTRALYDLVVGAGGEVLAVGVLVDQRIEQAPVAGHEVHALLHLPVQSYEAQDCPQCQRGDKGVEIRLE